MWCNVILPLIVYISFISIVTYGTKKYFDVKGIRNGFADLITSIVFFTSIAICFLVGYLGSSYYGHVIGNFFEKSNYEEKYFVNVFESDKTSKNYRLPADIRRSEKTYYVLKVYWPNGGNISFVDEDGYTLNEPRIYINRKTRVLDRHDKDWIIELTKDRVPDK